MQTQGEFWELNAANKQNQQQTKINKKWKKILIDLRKLPKALRKKCNKNSYFPQTQNTKGINFRKQYNKSTEIWAKTISILLM